MTAVSRRKRLAAAVETTPTTHPSMCGGESSPQGALREVRIFFKHIVHVHIEYIQLVRLPSVAVVAVVEQHIGDARAKLLA